MTRLNLEEKGLLQVLEKIERGGALMAPSTRYGLANEGLIEGDPATLSPLGKRVLATLRLRSARATGSVATDVLASAVKAR